MGFLFSGQFSWSLLSAIFKIAQPCDGVGLGGWLGCGLSWKLYVQLGKDKLEASKESVSVFSL